MPPIKDKFVEFANLIAIFARLFEINNHIFRYLRDIKLIKLWISKSSV